MTLSSGYRKKRRALWLIPVLFCLFVVLPAHPEPARDRSPQTRNGPEQTGPVREGPVPAQAAPARPDPAPKFRIVLIPETPRLGEPVTVGFVPAEGPEAEYPNLRAALINARGQRLTRAPFFTLTADPQGRPLKTAVLAVPSTAGPGAALIRVEWGTTLIDEIPITIVSRDFVREEIFLDQYNTDIRVVPDPQKNAESETLWAILSHTGGEVYATGPFTPPVSSTRRTSFFGDRRVYRYINGESDTAIHAGVDYGVPRGTPVRACAPGRVVLARFRIVTGNSVVLEHLPGVYSIYYHLDTIAAAEDTLVDAGTLLGESGSTGLSTGPHLHWEIRVAGETADPDAFLSRPILDKEAILSKING